MNVVAIPIIESNTELQGTRHSSMTARDVGGTTDRNSLSARHANGAAMLVEVDAAAVAVFLLVRLIAEGREVVRRLPVRKEGEQPQKHAVTAPRGRHAPSRCKAFSSIQAYTPRENATLLGSLQ